MEMQLCPSRACSLRSLSVLTLSVITIGWSLGPVRAVRLPSIPLRLSGKQLPSGVSASSVEDPAGAWDSGIKNHWALLVAGSSGWGNYRHQADVCHAYQVLRRGGLHPSRMVVMMADDIARDPANPFPGQVFNAPGGPDVYAGVPIDYRGASVTAGVLLAVLEGNASALPPGTRGSGRVLASGAGDRVFVFYSDHGSPGVLGMPSGPFLYADELVGALTRKYRRRGYREALLYIEACESGSMFEGLLPPDVGAYATTASNAVESSWGTYCPGMRPGAPPAFSTCLGDLYSVAWMENADRCDLTSETLMAQYAIVRARTSNNYTYAMGSHVMQYGSLAITREVAGTFEGMHNSGGTDADDAPACQVAPVPAPSPSPPPSPSPSPDPDPQPDPAPGPSRWLPWAQLLPSRPLRPATTGSGGSGGGEDAGGPLAALAAWLHGVRHWSSAALAAGRPAASAAAATATSSAAGAARRAAAEVAGEGKGEDDGGHPHPHRPHLQRGALPQRDADLAPLWHGAVHGGSEEERRRAKASLDRAVTRRRRVDDAAAAGAAALLAGRPHVAAAALAAAGHADAAAAATAAARTGAAVTLMADGGSGVGGGGPAAPWVALAAARLVSAPADGGARAAAGRPLVDDWGCLRGMVAAWEEGCGEAMDQYAMRHTRMAANLCNAGVAPAELAAALRAAAAALGPGEGCGAGRAAEGAGTGAAGADEGSVVNV
ncbi:hypothetical protein HYH03_009935 [Edaphochlamys debaryana]|uniref:legumain n=1 Tax=Edaphochlamys debaryana TaxID=47281 RepID=A0A835XXN0_9CHLO|nr:hypothetical protein HYH03_009935 [Edaphochlamys debaryana]|eukprot:KAG2491775.1 hypothetical protein HYH03_009935 [Edaphochlamys debaryana]